jgi:hypothetical protein
MSYTEQLERETEQSRSELAATITELKASMTPGQVLDQLTDYAGDGDAGAFYRNLRTQVGRNPVPVTLIGAGIAWMMFANRHGVADGRHDSDTARRIGDGADRIGESVSAGARSAASSVGEGARRAGDSVGNAAGQAATSVMRTASSAYDTVAGSASSAMSMVGDSASEVGHRTASTGRSFLAFCREEPLVLAGIGIALGAAIGTAFPSTEAENRLMGDKGDEARKALGDLAKPAASESPGGSEKNPTEWSTLLGEDSTEPMTDSGSGDAKAAQSDGADAEAGMPDFGVKKKGNDSSRGAARGETGKTEGNTHS